MARLLLNPEFRERLAAVGLRKPADFLNLQGVIVSGHPSRNVARVELAPGWTAYLKKQHRVAWGERIKNALAGFSLVSTSLREFRMLELASLRRVGCPTALAAGEANGQAFVLLEAVEKAVDLRVALRAANAAQRRDLAMRLGQALAHLHASGLYHPDVYAKHILCKEDDFVVLDWQRAVPEKGMPGSWRCENLAALDATLADDLATSRERLVLLQSYLDNECAFSSKEKPERLSRWAQAIQRASESLLLKRRIREYRRETEPDATQQVLWLDGERWCVTSAFQQRFPDPPGDIDSCQIAGTRLQRATYFRPLAWFRRFDTPELRRAGLLFRRQRQGQSGPRVLAFGQWLEKPWRVSSFLLIEETGGVE